MRRARRAASNPKKHGFREAHAVFSMACAGLLALLVCLAWYLLPRRPQIERSTATTLPSTLA